MIGKIWKYVQSCSEIDRIIKMIKENGSGSLFFWNAGSLFLSQILDLYYLAGRLVGWLFCFSVGRS